MTSGAKTSGTAPQGSRVGPSHVSIVGGGLAGLAAAVALAESGCRVELFESRRTLAGRAGSYRDLNSGELVDHCQHVSMGCCTNLTDFCRRVGIDQYFRRDRVLHFVGPDGRIYPFSASRLPAPLHLAPAFWGLKYLSVHDRLAIGRAMWRLMRDPMTDHADAPTVGAWLVSQGQSANAIERFWTVVLVSALGESLDRASLSAARKVFVDGFLAAREASAVDIPQAPLGVLYGEHLEKWLAEHGVALHLGTAIDSVSMDPGGRPQVVTSEGREVSSDYIVLALPWFRIAEVVSPSIASQWPWLAGASAVGSSPITGVHLWFDREIMPLPHAVLVDRLSQWIFKRTNKGDGCHYYQVVISASRNLAGRDREEIVAEVRRDLAAVWPESAKAELRAARVVSEHHAVFSVRPGFDLWRPSQQTPTERVFVAGDWTATGWPSTMESAVRSGYLAAEGILRHLSEPKQFLVPDLPREWLARMLIRD